MLYSRDPVVQLHSSGDPPLVGVARHSSGSSVHPRLSQCPRGHSVSSSPAPSYRVASQHGGVYIFASSVASPDRLICHLGESPLFDLFLSLPGPSVSGYRRLPTVLGQSSGVCFSSVVHHSPGSGQAPGVSGDGAHAGGSVLAPQTVVSGPPPVVAGSSGGPARPPRPPAPASVSSALPESPQASSSCRETLRRFTRAAGFSSAVASQASLGRRPSSRHNRSWCHSHGHSVSRPTLSKVANFLCWLRSARGLSFSSIKGYRSMLSAVFRFHLRPCPPILSCVTFFGPSGFPRRSACCILLPDIYLWFFGSSTLQRSSFCLRLHFVTCRRRCCFSWPLLRPNELGSCRLCPLWLPLSVVMPAFLMFLSLWPSCSHSPVPSLAPSW